MKYLLALLLAVSFVGASCDTPAPQLVATPVTKDADDCARLVALGCAAGSDPHCAVVMARLRFLGTPPDVCLATAKGKADVVACGAPCP